jgi:VWFA-related protein
MTPTPRIMFAVAAWLMCTTLLWPGGVCSQEKTKRDFGSSLKRLKWDPNKKAAVEVQTDAKQSAEELDEGDVIRVESTLVVFDVLVADKQGRGVKGLTANDFIVNDDDQPQEIVTFTLGDDPNRPRSIVLLIDHSGSQRPYLEKSIAAAKTLISQLRPNDQMAIVTDDVELVADYTSDKKKLAKTLDRVKEKAEYGEFGLSAQYSALMATLKELVVGRQRPIVIFQTDGDELGKLRSTDGKVNGPQFREFSLVDLINAAELARATIYTVIPNVQIVGLPEAEQLRRIKERLGRYGSTSIPVAQFNQIATGMVREQTALEGLSRLSGGWTEFLEDPKDAARIYERILSDINRRYVIGFQPTNKSRDGKRRKLKIVVRDHPDYIVWGRKFYYGQTR